MRWTKIKAGHYFALWETKRLSAIKNKEISDLWLYCVTELDKDLLVGASWTLKQAKQRCESYALQTEEFATE